MIFCKHSSTLRFYSFSHFFVFFVLVVHCSLFASLEANVSDYAIADDCKCFVHCSCFGQCIGNYDVCFPADTPNHPRQNIDKVWHEFMKEILTAKKVGPFFTIERYPLQQFVGYQKNDKNSHSISDYLDIIERFRNRLAQAKQENIKTRKKLYPEPRFREQVQQDIKRINQEYREATEILDQLPSKIIPLYQEVIHNCSHSSLFSTYNKGLICSLEGQWDQAIVEIQNFIGLAEKQQSQLLDSKVYQIYGESCLEVHLFQDAIDALTTAIQKNPENKQAYFYRAAAYFEIGDFDQAIEDYLMSDKGKAISTSYKASKDFTSALIDSARQGMKEAVIEFFPSMMSSAYGLSETLWAMDPINPDFLKNTQKFANICYEMGENFVDYCKDLEWETIDDYVDQIKHLYEHYDQLNEAEKGELFGYTIGKYGLDILVGGVVLKGIKVCRNLKNINRSCNLEAMAASQANKEAIASSALQHATTRNSFFESVKIEWDKQNKHIVGKHNYEIGKGIFEHPDAEGLLSRFAGRGKPVNGKAPGMPDYRERVDFGEFIGYYIDPANPNIKLPTTKGIIRYSKKRAHIVPSHPDGT